MPVPRIKRRADRGTRALKQLAGIGAEVADLADEDLLDLVDILGDRTGSFVGGLATAEMTRRGLSL